VHWLGAVHLLRQAHSHGGSEWCRETATQTRTAWRAKTGTHSQVVPVFSKKQSKDDPGVTLGSRNFNWSVPLAGLKGRAGLDLSVSLYYNSLVWTKQGSSISI
jgi:hypothetical protein